MFDEIVVYQKCPYCKKWGAIDCQTKDLSSSLHNYDALPEDWYTNKIERKFRIRLPVFSSFPMDKSNRVWKNQAERREAMATVPKEFQKLKFINVIASCESMKCKAWADKRDKIQFEYVSGFSRAFEGKIKIKNGKLIGKIYDIVKIDNKIKKRKK